MTTLKPKIKRINSLPPEIKQKKSFIDIFIPLIFIFVLLSIGYFLYKELHPYFNAIDIKKISGKKTYISECNTKNYVIIGNDKTYSLEISDEECNTKNYEGNLKIKNNEIIFDNNMKGYIDNNYNIKINDKLFKSE